MKDAYNVFGLSLRLGTVLFFWIRKQLGGSKAPLRKKSDYLVPHQIVTD
jgi:hypothetical protein